MPTPKDPAKQELVTVYSAEDELEAGMLQELLKNAGIESTINAEVAPGLYPGKVGGLAKQDILVLESRAEEARRIISEHHEGSGMAEVV